MLKIEVSADALARSDNSSPAQISPKVVAVADALANSPAIFEAIGGRLRLSSFPFLSVMTDESEPDYFDRRAIPVSPSQGTLNHKGSQKPFIAFGLLKSSGEETVAVLHLPESQNDWALCLNKKDISEFAPVMEAFRADKVALIRNIFAGKGLVCGKTSYTLINTHAVKIWR